MNLDPPLPVSVITVLCGLAILIAIWREIQRKRKLAPGWFHFPCLFFRVAAILTLVVILLNPSRELSNKQPEGRSVILLDASASMNLGADGETRWEAATKFANSALEEIKAAGLTSTRLLTFSTDLDTDSLSDSPIGRETNLSSALERLLAGSGSEAPEQVIILSDGRIHDRDRLGIALGLANAAHVPISTSVFGIDSPPRNASLAAVQAPRMVRPKSPVSVHVDISGSGIAPDETLSLKLVDEDGKLLSQTEFVLPENGRPVEQVLVFESGLRTGRYELQLSTSGEAEVELKDNRFSFTVEIATGKLRVLFAEGTHCKRAIGERGHCWNDMEFMTRAWEATGDIEHVCLTPWSQYLNEPNLAGVTFANGEMLLDRTKDFPKTREELNAFDVVIISDVPEGNFSKEQMEWVVDWVKNRGGGFLMGGGNTAFDSGKYDKTPWEQIVPVDMVSYGDGNLREWFEIDIPKSVRNHPLWTVSLDPKANEKILAAHPRFTGMNLVRRAKPGALVLATRRGTGDPVIAAQRYGRGRAVAFMPDPNGGGGTFYIEWGTEGSPIMGANFRQMELGHGKGFRFNKESAETDYGPEPEYPSKWYGQYWVNMVRWLGENSVRWQRDKLAGRVVAAQARPGERLAVAAEVLAVSQIDELLALDVGARLEGTGSRRVRLLYDRDRREFTGDLLVPSDLGEKTEVIVLFDVEVKNQTLSQSVSTGIYRGNPEFSESAPDPVFLSDLAKATGGSVLENPGDAADSIREAAEKRLSEARRSWSEPLWSRGWPWLIFAICFCLEWTLRRLGSRVQADPIPVPSAAILIGFLLVTTGISAEVDQTSKLTEEWIAQLGADRVRLRDEADRHLREDPDSYGALVAFSGETKNGEAKARAENILRHFKSHRWHLVAIRNGGLTQLDKGNTISRGLIVSPQKTRLYSRERGFARVWNAVTYEPLETFGEPSYSVKDGRLTAGIATALAISADSKRIAATNEFGETIIYDPKSFMEVRRFSEVTAKAFVELGKPNLKGAILSLQFLSDNRKLLAGTAAGVRLWDSDTGKLMWKTESTEPAFSMVTTPDRTKLIYCGDSPRANDQLYTVDLQSGKMLLKMEAPTRLGGLQFNSTGKKLLGFGQDGFARVFDFDSQTSELSNERSYGPNSNECQGAAWGPDETTVLTTSWNPKQPVIEWDLETGEPVWKSPPMEVGLCTPAWIDRERIAILGEEGVLTIWKYTGG